MLIVNLGAIVSSRLGETSRNLTGLFHQATRENSILFIDEFDSLGKVRDYTHDHGEMKRVVNSLLQLFDYLPKGSIVIAATNQKSMLDDAILRRFDTSIALDLPDPKKITELISLTLNAHNITFEQKKSVDSIIRLADGLSYHSIQKTLLKAAKHSLFEQKTFQTH